MSDNSMRMPDVTRPAVSIVTPSYNQARFLGETLESVAAQQYPDLEHIVVDGGSTDGSVALLADYARRHPHLRWVSEPDNGQADGVNKGIRMSRGEIIGWVNSDDRYCPGAVRAAVEAFKAAPEAVMVYGSALTIDERGTVRGGSDWVEDFDAERLLRVHNYIAQPAVFLRRRAFDRIGLLDPSLNWTMDWDLWIRVSRAGEVRRIPGALACMREYPATKTGSGGWRRFREVTRLLRRHGAGRWPPAYSVYLFNGLDWALRSALLPDGRSEGSGVRAALVRRFPRYRISRWLRR